MKMNEHQRNLRQAAEEAFKESLERLQQSLLLSEEEEEVVEIPKPTPAVTACPQPQPAAPDISLDELEDAVKDIEAFLSHHDIAQGKLL